MEIDLKRENSKNIFLIMAASLAASAFFQFELESISTTTEMFTAGGASLMLSVILVMLANVIPQSLKHKFIFTRIKNELPACRVDKLCRNDHRVEYKKLVKRWPEVFSPEIDDATRNSRWYKQIYKPVKDEKEVLQAHRSFLLYRDSFSGLVIIFLGTMILSLVGNPEIIGEIKPIVLVIQGALTILSLIAARVAGNRFVVNAVVTAE